MLQNGTLNGTTRTAACGTAGTRLSADSTELSFTHEDGTAREGWFAAPAQRERLVGASGWRFMKDSEVPRIS